MDAGALRPSLSPTRANCHSPTTDKHVRSSYVYYDMLYAFLDENRFNTSTRVGSVEVVPPQNVSSPSMSIDSELALLRVTSIVSFTARVLDDKGDYTLELTGSDGSHFYGDSTGLLLAVHHFNNGIGSVVEEIAGINETCPIRFVADNFHDSESSQINAVSLLGQQIIASPDRPPSVVFGAYRSDVSKNLAILSGAYKIPLISPLSTSTELSDTLIYRYFGRLVPSDEGAARAAVDYLRSRLDLTHLGVLYVNDSYGRAYFEAIVDASEDLITVKGFPFSYNNVVSEDAKQIAFAVKELASTKYKVFFGIFYDYFYQLIMENAYREKIVGPGYLWLTSDGFSETYLDGREYEAGSPLAVASQGIGILKAEGGRQTPERNTGYDRFTNAWFDQGEDAVSYYNCKQPVSNSIGDTSIYYRADGDFFSSRRLNPTAGAAFVYDSVIAMGLAACQLAGENRTYDNIDGEALFDSFIKQSFEGASGQIKVDSATNTRDPRSAFFVLYNAAGTTENGTTHFKVESVAHSLPNSNGASSVVLWTEVRGKAFIYSDGTIHPPPMLPPIEGEDLNQLNPAVRGAGLALSGLILAGSLFCCCWAYWRRNTRVVKASQLAFLQMICCGTVIMGSTIVTLSVDDSVASKRGCDIACMATPWLLVCGFVFTFSALFSKTWSINQQVFADPNLRRVRISNRDILLPFLTLSSLNTTVLVVWTILAPLEWKRVPLDGTDEFGRGRHSYGTCTEGNAFIPFVAVLLVINLSALLLGNFLSYRARTVSTEHNESMYIGVIMAFMLQGICIGLPLLLLVKEKPPAFFFLQAGFIFAICMCALVLMFVPKIVYLRNHLREKGQSRDVGDKNKSYGKTAEQTTVGVSRRGTWSGSSSFPERAARTSQGKRDKDITKEPMKHPGNDRSGLNTEKKRRDFADEVTCENKDLMDFNTTDQGIRDKDSTQKSMNDSGLVGLCASAPTEKTRRLSLSEELQRFNQKSLQNISRDQQIYERVDCGFSDSESQDFARARNPFLARSFSSPLLTTMKETTDPKGDDQQSLGSHDVSISDDGIAGIAITGFSKADRNEVRRLRERVEHLKQQKLNTQKSAVSLKLLLSNRDANAAETLLDSMMREVEHHSRKTESYDAQGEGGMVHDQSLLETARTQGAASSRQGLMLRTLSSLTSRARNRAALFVSSRAPGLHESAVVVDCDREIGGEATTER